jgi:hypothetical protein
LLLVLAITLPGRLDDRGVNDLTAFGQIAGPGEMLIETSKQIVDGAGADEAFPKQPDRLGVRHLLRQ